MARYSPDNLPGEVRFKANIDAVLASMQHFSDFMSREAYRLESGARSIAKQLLLDTFDDAARAANANDGFPEEFQNHLLSVVNDMPIFAEVSGSSIFVTADFGYLGDWEDLKTAFHQGAKLAEGGFVDGPYRGEQLANESAEERHVFWEAVRKGATRVANPKGTGSIRIAPGAWEQTKRKYVEIWGEKAPEWLYVQFGQEQWSPQVPAQNVLDKFGADLVTAMNRYLFVTLEEEVRIANQYQTVGADVGFTAKGGVRLRDKPVTVNGKTYKPGQFIPKNIG